MGEEAPDITGGGSYEGRLHPEYRPPVSHLMILDEFVDPDSLNVAQMTHEWKLRVNAIKEVWVRQARDSFPAFMQYAFVDYDNERGFEQQWFHDDWSAAMDKYNRLLIVAPRNHGKCLSDNSLVTLSNGRRIKAKDLPEFFEVMTWSESTGWFKARARKWDVCYQPVVTIKTASGRSETVSFGHPFWTPQGWVESLRLKKGDRVALSRGVPCGDVSYNVDLAYLLGFLLADGYLTSKYRVGVTINPCSFREIERTVLSLGWKLTHKKAYDYAVVGVGDTYGQPVRWTMGLGIHGLKSAEKMVPPEVFTWDMDALSAFLAGYLEGDGSVTDGKVGRVIEFYSVSRSMLEDVQSLLLRLNVYSGLSLKNGKYKGKRHVSWRLSVSCHSIDSLMKRLPLRGYKIKALRDLGEREISGGSVDLIPDELLDRLLPTRFSKKTKPRLDCRQKNGHNRKKVMARNDVPVRLQVNSQLSWDIVSDVVHVGIQRTWSIEVENVNTHLAGDFITHNTSQVVGRIIWELGRNPNLRTKIACASDGRAKERLFEISQNILYNQRVKEVFPGLMPDEDAPWNVHKIHVKRTAMHKDASVEALGITATATGGRCDLLISDDVVDRRNALSMPGLRKQIKQAWLSDWSNLLEPKGRILGVCTLWHKDDMNHMLMENPAYHTLFYAVEQSFGSLWHSKWPESALRAKFTEIGSVEFNRGYRNQAVDMDSQMVQGHWIAYRDLLGDDAFRSRVEQMRWLLSYDPAGSPTGNKEQDFSASVVLAIDVDVGIVYVVDAWCDRLTLKEMAKRVSIEARKYLPFRIVIEKVGQSSLDEWVANDYPELAELIVTVSPKENKTLRLMGCTPLFEKKQVVFSSHLDPNSSIWVPGKESIIHQLEDAPFAKHDDMTDALSQGLMKAKRYWLDDWATVGDNREVSITIGSKDDAKTQYRF